MLSFAVLTIAGAFDRQLPVPESHFLPFGVCVPGVEGLVLATEGVDDSATDVFDDAFCSIPLLLGVVAAVLAASGSDGTSGPVLLLLWSSAGAWGLGFVFLRGFILTGRVKDVGRRNGRWRGY